MSFKFAYKTLINSCGRPAERKSNVKCKNMEKKAKKSHTKQRISSYFVRKVVCLPYLKGFAHFFLYPLETMQTHSTSGYDR